MVRVIDLVDSDDLNDITPVGVAYEQRESGMEAFLNDAQAEMEMSMNLFGAENERDLSMLMVAQPHYEG